MLTQQSGNNECFETRNRESEFSFIMKSRFDKGHVTPQNTGRVILALGVKIAKSSAGWVSALESGTRHVRIFRRAGGMYFVHTWKLRPCAIRARGVDVLELGLRWANRRVRGGRWAV